MEIKNNMMNEERIEEMIGKYIEEPWIMIESYFQGQHHYPLLHFLF